MFKYYYYSLFFLLSTIYSASQVQLGGDINGALENCLSGISLDLSSDGSILAIGSPFSYDGSGTNGFVKVYKFNGINWDQIGDDIIGDFNGDVFGYSLSLSADGTILAIGAPKDDGNGENSGRVSVYEYSGGNWNQLGNDLYGTFPGRQLGSDVSLSSDGLKLAIGQEWIGGGTVFIYRYESGSWISSGTISGERSGDRFGNNLELSYDGSILAISAPYNDGVTGTNYSAGHVRVFENQSGGWTQLGDDIDGIAAGDLFGSSMDISSDGKVIAIGAPHNGGGGNQKGQVKVLEYESGSWTQIGNDINGETNYDGAGWGVSLSDNGYILAVGIPFDDNSSGIDSGRIVLYQNLSGIWTQIGNDIYGEAANNFLGWNGMEISNEGKTFGVAAIGNDNSEIDSGLVRVYDLNNIVLSDDENENLKCELFPVPTRDFLSVAINNNSVYSIFDIRGKKLKAGNLNSGNNQIDLLNFENGVYLIEIKGEEKSAYKRKIIKI